MTLQNLYFFSEIVKDMNLGVTADRLFTSQQALSGHIKRLESHFGVKLFDRKPNLVLTDEGKLLVSQAKVILDVESRLFIAYGTGVQKDCGSLRIACGLGRSKYYLPGVLSQFSTQYPAVTISCVDENLYKEKPMFTEGGVDLAIGRIQDNSPGVKHIPLFRTGSSLLISRKLLQKNLGNETDAFIARGLEHGVDIRQLPRTVPIQHSGMPGQEHWLCSLIPELRDFPRVYISHGNSDMLFEICRTGRAMVLISNLYSRFIRESFSPEMQKDVLFFDLVVDGKQIWSEEVLSYHAAVVHPQFFFDFISVLMENLQSKGLMDGSRKMKEV